MRWMYYITKLQIYVYANPEGTLQNQFVQNTYVIQIWKV